MSTFLDTSEQEGFLKELILRTKKAFYYVAFFSLFINILMLALPLYSMQVLDRVMSSHSYSTLIALSVLMTALLTFCGILTAIRSLVLNRVTEWLEVRVAPLFVANAVHKSALGSPTSAGQHQRDFYSIKGFITGAGLTSLLDAPWSIIYLLVIYMINPVLGALALGGAVVLMGFAVITELATKKPLDTANGINLKSIAIADTASRNAEVIEAMGMLPQIISNWQQSNEKNLELQNIANNRANIILSSSKVVRLLLQIGVIGIGGALALQGEITSGGVIAASILVGRALGPFEAAISVWKSVLSAREAYTRLTLSTKATPFFRGNMDLPAPIGALSVENLFFQPLNTKAIVRGVNFKLQPGEALGIIGASAAGKSTLIKLLIGVLPPTNGAVRLDNADIFKWNRENIGRYIGYLPQDVELFSGTIRDNIARMHLDAPSEGIIEAAQLAGVHEMILRLPKGYETEFGQGNVGLSPGQRQRIGLARALYGNPIFVVLDEPNSNLDGDGEAALIESLKRLKERGVTTIVVAHRPSIIAHADKILMLRDGMVEQFGPREQVLQKYIAPAPGTQPPSGQQRSVG